MSEYPELDGYESHNASEFSSKDLSTRERELLGEDGAAALVGDAPDIPALSGDELDAEIDVSTSVPTTITGSNTTLGFTPGAGPEAYVPQKVELSESEFLKDWKVKRDLEIERRDKVSNDKRESTREKARKSIDDFYENYNSKKESETETVRKDAEEFAKKRDAQISSGKGTTWDRIAELMDGLGRPAEGVTLSDKKRFAELVQSLKGDPNAPGAAGF